LTGFHFPKIMAARPGISPGSSGTLFLIWTAIRGWRTAPADDSGQHDDRQQVRQPGEEVVVDAWIGLLDTGQERTQVTCRWGEADRYTDRLGPMKRSAPPNAPSGVQRPKIMAARAMNPRPAVILFWKEPVASSVR
jgi:hypothetical protein